MIEKRLTERLSRYWSQIRADKSLPDIRHLNPERIYDLWPNCMTLEVVNMHARSLAYTYQYVGDGMRKVYGKDLTGEMSMSKLRDQPGWQLLRKVDDVTAQPRIETEEGQFINANNRIVKYRACLLPFGTGDKVSHVVVGMSYKEFA